MQCVTRVCTWSFIDGKSVFGTMCWQIVIVPDYLLAKARNEKFDELFRSD